jgi:Domain of unknown function (DUF4148)
LTPPEKFNAGRKKDVIAGSRRRLKFIRKRGGPTAQRNAVGSGNFPASFIFQFHIKDIVMNTKNFFAAAVAAIAAITTLGAGSAHANDAGFEYPVAVTSTVSRADVKAEALRARAAGLIAQGELSIVIADTGPSLTRAQVKAELAQALRIGAIDDGERSVTPTAAQLESIRLAGLRAVVMTMASR